jgi:hypothetical protein
MLLELGDKIISTQIFEQKFVCDLNACKGACCIQGDAGAPLSWSEVENIQADLEKIKPSDCSRRYLTKKYRSDIHLNLFR